MAKRAKRSNNHNPRQERNNPETTFNSRNQRGNRRNISNSSNNIIDFPSISKKKQVELIPRNVNQESLMAALEDDRKHIVFATGPAGTGKTFLATLIAIKMLRAGQIQKIIITRPNVAVDDKDIGFLPGDILKKLMPWCMPVLEIFGEYYSQKEIVQLLEEGTLELLPIAFIRGRTLKHSFIILDEAQNTTPSSMLSVLTRIGEGSKMCVTGDIRQGDRGSKNGLSDFANRFISSQQISMIEFEQKDVSRHPVIKEILALYGEE